MNTTVAALVVVASLVAVLAVVHAPFGDHMARVYSGPGHWRVERGIYRLLGVDPDREQSWAGYARGVLAFSAVSVLFLFLLQWVQSALPLSLGFDGVPPALAWNTAASFVTRPTSTGDTSSLRLYLNRLRRKLEPDPSRPRHLVTEPGMGYRFQP